MKNKALLLIISAFVASGLYAQKTVSLVMPFCSKRILENPSHKDAELGNMSREYYQGMLIALDSLGRAGEKVKLNVYDTQNDSMTLVKLIQKKDFQESDLIIGPVLQGGNKVLTDFSKQKKIYHISPLMTFSRTKLADQYWVSSNPDLPGFAAIIYQNVCKMNHDSANIIVVSDKSSLDKNISPAFRKIVPASKTVKIKVVDYSAGMDVNALLSATLPNIIVVPTNKEQVANSTLYRIKDTADVNRLMCIGFQQWFDFKNADITLWQKKNTAFISTSFVDYADEHAKRFLAAYRDRFAAEPGEAAVKGYDQGLFYIGLLLKDGKKFMEDAEGKPFRMVHTTYQFIKLKDSGAFQNNYLNLIGFEDNILKRIN